MWGHDGRNNASRCERGWTLWRYRTGSYPHSRSLRIRRLNHEERMFADFKRSILLAGLLVIGASYSAFAQNKTIGFKPGAVLSQGRVVGNMLFVAGLRELLPLVNWPTSILPNRQRSPLAPSKRW